MSAAHEQLIITGKFHDRLVGLNSVVNCVRLVDAEDDDDPLS